MELIERIRERPNDAPLPTEYMLDEAADELWRLWDFIVYVAQVEDRVGRVASLVLKGKTTKEAIQALQD